MKNAFETSWFLLLGAVEKAPRGQNAPGQEKPHRIYPLEAARNAYTVKELPQPQVLLTFGLLNLNPEPSRVSM